MARLQLKLHDLCAEAEGKKVVKKATDAAGKVKAETTKAAKKVTTAAKKAVAPTTSVTIEYQGRQLSATSIVDQALSVYKEAHKNTIVDTLEVYVKPEENVAYYVVNGEGSDDFKIYL